MPDACFFQSRKTRRNSSIRTRFAHAGDAPFVTALSPRFAECEIPPWRRREDIVQGTAAQLRAAIAAGNSERSAVFIAEDDGEAVGFAWVLLLEDFYTKEPIGKVSEIAVSRSGAGTGQALMARCERWARERGARLMTLNALEGNRYARRFYELNGYAPEYTMYVKRMGEEDLAVTRRFDGAADEEHRHDEDEADADEVD